MITLRSGAVAAAIVLGLVLAGAGLSGAARAQGTMVGPEVCAECHKAEVQVWEGTVHFKSFRELHKSKDPDAKAIVEAAGGDKNPKKNETCTLCHYAMVAKKEGDEAKAVSGPACESCHGAASEWVKIHNDYGGPGVKAADETPEHKQQRMQQASAAGMIWPAQKFDIAMNCMNCHGMARPGLDAAVLAKMMDAGHPIKPEYELVQYSQGTVRHRFYPPDVTKNAEMTPAELANLFVAGQAAKLVSAAAVVGKSDNAKYKAAQEQRLADAKAALGKLAAPEAKALIDAPTVENARKLVDAIAGKDLSGEVGGLLPAAGTYK
ncbi:MAG: hypothetical protein FJX56_10830 [Alphaproteobacteria bacterium]|nr:hypothetical protein [Alphaproteobacteria bacterium]